MNRNELTVEQTRHDDPNSVNRNCMISREPIDHHIASRQERRNRVSGRKPTELGHREAATHDVAAESRDVVGRSRGHVQSEERRVDRREKGEGGAGHYFVVDVGGGDGIGEEVVASSSHGN